MHIYKEGSKQIDGIWLTLDGEFQISKKIRIKNEVIKDRKRQGQIAIVSKNQIIGLEEITLDQESRQNTVMCFSQTASAYFIDIKVFRQLQTQNMFDKQLVAEMLYKKRQFSKERMRQTQHGLFCLNKLINEENKNEYVDQRIAF